MEGESVLSIADIYAWLEEEIELVNAVVGIVFHHLNGTRRDRESFEICGWCKARCSGDTSAQPAS